jgi:hypothetical protein
MGGEIPHSMFHDTAPFEQEYGSAHQIGLYGVCHASEKRAPTLCSVAGSTANNSCQ